MTVVCQDEYKEVFLDAIELNVKTPSHHHLNMLNKLDGETLREMRREKLKGWTNLYDVPREYIVYCSGKESTYTDHYRPKEKIQCIAGSSVN